MNRAAKYYHNIMNEMEACMAQNPLAKLPLEHKFADKIYIRSIFIPAGVVLSSRVHLTEHPYNVSMGDITIVTQKGIMAIKAPYDGINERGTRRLGIAISDVLWTTYHYNEDNCKDIPTLEARLFRYYNNPLLKLNKNIT